MVQSLEDKVKTALYAGAQKDAFKSMDDIKAVFVANGVSAKDFDNGINSFAVNNLVKKQEQTAEEFKVHSVPAILVNKKYEMNLKGFSDSTSENDFIKRYVNAVTFLIKK